ncbi:hypothetical protein AVEN_226755-1 [Araneus ventricosus]|uniref:Uncharacterized protein n=1 Tax=Araneus ventricosus TaxID=182803 RepID=A0A4Y2GH10_ARAVE|nr:hypothetical protein AVEN_226755-1 [Araneus ventricosus]
MAILYPGGRVVISLSEEGDDRNCAVNLDDDEMVLACTVKKSEKERKKNGTNLGREVSEAATTAGFGKAFAKLKGCNTELESAE